MHAKLHNAQATLMLSLAMVAAAALYWVGLTGPFIFDDWENFAVIQRWVEGHASWREVVFGSQSLFYARPVAMASFLLNAFIGQGDGFYFKLGNLFVHLACGWLIFLLLRRALAEDRRIGINTPLLASLLAALWLLHPLHVSTVLYAVQRMAQLSALFTLTAVWLYFVARQNLATGQTRKAGLQFFILLPLLVLLGFFSKQNAVLAPALCLIFELAYFNEPRARPRMVHVFFSAFLFLPALLGGVLFILYPDRLLVGYADYDFTLGERLLSQPRALMEYLGQLVLPRGPTMGLYTDDFAISVSLLSPATTLLSILALTGISIAAIAVRMRAPSIFAGWFFFLVAHAVESSFLPLDLYFEHRNYLPSVGLLFVGAGSCGWAADKLKTNVLSVRQLGFLAAGCLALVFSFATLGRCLVWQNKASIVSQGLKYHPKSLRANLDKAAMAQKAERFGEYGEVMESLKRSDNPQHRRLGFLYSASLSCVRNGLANPLDLTQALAQRSSKVNLADVFAFRAVSNVIKTKSCRNITDATLADAIVQVLAWTPNQSDALQPKWLLRVIAAEMYARSGLWQLAQPQAELAWQPKADPNIGMFLAQIYIENKHYDAAKRQLLETAARTKCYDEKGLDAMKHWTTQLGPQRTPEFDARMQVLTQPCN